MVSCRVGLVVWMVVVMGGEEGSQLVSGKAGKRQLTQVAKHDGRLRAFILTYLSRSGRKVSCRMER